MQISEEEFADMFRTFRHTAFRLETQPSYRMTDEREAFGWFLAGEPREPSDLPWWQSWLDDMAKLTQQGKRIARVRFVDDPPTDYQRWEMWATRWHSEAGEDIRYLRRGTAHDLGITSGDWWLFDEVQLVVMNFTSEGAVDGKTLITDPGVILNYRLWRALATQYATTAERAVA